MKMSSLLEIPSDGDLQTQFKELAEGIISDLADFPPDRRKELLGEFVSELYFAAVEQNRREELRQRQAEGIAAAKAKGVRFGRTKKPLPDNFDEFHRAWRAGKMTLTSAARACGMTRTTFYSSVQRKEQADICAD